jgi:hypothetical protein
VSFPYNSWRARFLIDADRQIGAAPSSGRANHISSESSSSSGSTAAAGVGALAARALFAQFPGAWLVHEVSGNDAAVNFWRTAIPVAFGETTDEHGTTQTFLAPHP